MLRHCSRSPIFAKSKARDPSHVRTLAGWPNETHDVAPVIVAPSRRCRSGCGYRARRMTVKMVMEWPLLLVTMLALSH